jgi:hypothetical protein
MQKSEVKITLAAFFDAKVIFHHEFVPEKQTVNGNFFKELSKRLTARVHRLSLSKVGPGIFCTTVHLRILRAWSPSFM